MRRINRAKDKVGIYKNCKLLIEYFNRIEEWEKLKEERGIQN